jgi:glycosyltransferase involved in cell wall biosynthesis
VKILIHGHDNVGWSTDADARAVSRALVELGYGVTRRPWRADVLHSVCWSELLTLRTLPLRLIRNVVATVADNIEPETDVGFAKLRRWVSVWVAANRAQYARLERAGVRVAYQPFYVDENVFRPLGLSKDTLAASLGIPVERIKGKYIIGSFQRDTLGRDLSKPKWQKDPDLLLSILEGLPEKERWVALFTGPRRHYVIAEATRRGIPFIYYGTPPIPGVDDILTNIQSQERMVELYNLCDVNLVTSRLEGGPKAVIESALCGCPVLSTPVGLAPDFLPESSLYTTKDEAIRILRERIRRTGTGHADDHVERTREQMLTTCNYAAYKERWAKIYAEHFRAPRSGASR